MVTRSGIQYAHTEDGASIAYEIVGNGPVDLLAVPGFTSHLDLLWDVPGYRDWIEGLASFARVITFDRRGSGLSDRTGDTSALDDQAEDVHAVMSAVESTRAHVLGWSEAGAISAILAATHPELTTSLVLYGATARLLVDDDYPAGLPVEVVAAFREWLMANWGREDAAPVELVSPSRAGDPIYIRAWARMYRAALSPREAGGYIDRLAETDYRHVLPTVQVPTLVLHRGGDRFVPVEMGRYLAEAIERATYVELPGNDHPPWCGDVEGLVSEIRAFVTGDVAPTTTTRRLASVLFTDIVASTQRLAEVGDAAWRHVLGEHARLVSSEIEHAGGRFIKSTGDGVLATFDMPGRAIHCAQRLIESVSGLGIEIRAGVHTGEIEVLGDDVAGLAVHLAARVSAAAAAGEVLVTRTVKDLVAGGGFAFEDLGQREYKGIPGEWAAYRVTT